MSDASDYTIPVHGERRGLPHVEIEIRQDLIADAAGQRLWGARIARLLPQAYAELLAGETRDRAMSARDGRTHSGSIECTSRATCRLDAVRPNHGVTRW